MSSSNFSNMLATFNVTQLKDNATKVGSFISGTLSDIVNESIMLQDAVANSERNNSTVVYTIDDIGIVGGMLHHFGLFYFLVIIAIISVMLSLMVVATIFLISHLLGCNELALEDYDSQSDDSDCDSAWDSDSEDEYADEKKKGEKGEEIKIQEKEPGMLAENLRLHQEREKGMDKPGKEVFKNVWTSLLDERNSNRLHKPQILTKMSNCKSERDEYERFADIASDDNLASNAYLTMISN